MSKHWPELMAIFMGDSYFVLFEFISKHFGSVQSSVSTKQSEAYAIQNHHIHVQIVQYIQPFT